MIPRIIHYCWFGGNPLPPLAQKCIASWKKHCPDYEIIRWDESNFDISACPLYVRQAYESRKWPFVTDYVRLKVVHDYGGIYMDTDVELLKPMDELLQHGAFFGFEDGKFIATGLGFGAEKGSAILKELMAEYDEIAFVLADGQLDKTPCPKRNTAVFVDRGLIQNNTKQILAGDILILPKEYLCPMDYFSGKKTRTRNTVSIHWFAESWKTEQEKQIIREIRKQKRMSWKIMNCCLTRLKLFGKKLIGTEAYERIKAFLKR